MISKPHSALVLVGHGSTLNPDSSGPTHNHADAIRARGIFREVVTAFWKEEPSMREVLRTVDSREVFIVPNFISEGYFTQQVIPRELGLTGRTTRFPWGLTAHYCDPVGVHRSMTKLLLARAAEVAPGVPRSESSLVIVGHGTGLNDNSTKAIKDQVEIIRNLEGERFAEVTDAYMEEPPLVADWAKLTTAPNVIVVPFFIADGLHSYQDIPVLLGMEKEPTAAASQREVFRHNPYVINGRRVFYSSAIGTEPMLADVILDQVAAFEEKYLKTSPAEEARAEESRENLTEFLERWLRSGGERVGQVSVRPDAAGGWRLTHVADREAERGGNGRPALETFTKPEDARRVALYNESGEYRPLKSAPDLKRGWELRLPDASAVRLALDFLYPAALGNYARWKEGGVPRRFLREDMLERQTGMYKVTALAREDELASAVAATCDTRTKCLRKIHWSLSRRSGEGASAFPLPEEKTAVCDSGGEMPVICTDACPLLTGAIRDIVARRRKAEREAAAAAAGTSGPEDSHPHSHSHSHA